MPTETALPADHPLMIAWEAYQKTDEYENTARWASHPEHLTGSLWAAFREGWFAYQHMMQERKAQEAMSETTRLATKKT